MSGSARAFPNPYEPVCGADRKPPCAGASGRHGVLLASLFALTFLAWPAISRGTPGDPAGAAGAKPAANVGQPGDWNKLAGGKDEPPAPSPAPAAASATPAPVAVVPTPPSPTAAPAAPAAPSPSGEFSKTPLRRPDDPAAGGNPGDPPPTGSATSDIPRVLLALAIVLAIIFFLKWAGRRFFTTPSAGRSSRAVQVLARSVLSPKQQVVLIQVGRRVLVAADSGAQMSPLAEITDPDEVAALVGQLRAEKDASVGNAVAGMGGAMGTAFGGLLARVRKHFGRGSDDGDDETDGAVGGSDGPDEPPPRPDRAQLSRRRRRWGWKPPIPRRRSPLPGRMSRD